MCYFKKEPHIIFCHQHFNFRKQLLFGAQKFVLATLFELVHCSILNLNILVYFWYLETLLTEKLTIVYRFFFMRKTLVRKYKKKSLRISTFLITKLTIVQKCHFLIECLSSPLNDAPKLILQHKILKFQSIFFTN